MIEFESKTKFIENIFIFDRNKLIEYIDIKNEGLTDSDPYIVYGYNKYNPLLILEEQFNITTNIEVGKLYPFTFDNINYDVIFSPIAEDIYVLSILKPNFLKESIKTTLILVFFVFIIAFFVILTLSKKHKFITDEMISKENILRVKSEYIAYIDELTELPNRYKLNMKLDKIVSEKIPTTILYLDFDGFKSINDNYGHSAGDYTLKEITKLISTILPKNMKLYRVGGDEFILLGKLIPKQKSEDLARDINSISSTKLQYGESVFNLLGISIGIINFPDQAKNKAEILHNADQAMYAAKINCSNSFVFYNL